MFHPMLLATLSLSIPPQHAAFVQTAHLPFNHHIAHRGSTVSPLPLFIRLEYSGFPLREKSFGTDSMGRLFTMAQRIRYCR